MPLHKQLRHAEVEATKTKLAELDYLKESLPSDLKLHPSVKSGRNTRGIKEVQKVIREMFFEDQLILYPGHICATIQPDTSADTGHICLFVALVDDHEKQNHCERLVWVLPKK